MESAAHASPADHTDVVESVVHACATLWHETAEEMTQLLKSIFRYLTLSVAILNDR